jgi:hypothetical protein
MLQGLVVRASRDTRFQQMIDYDNEGRITLMPL